MKDKSNTNWVDHFKNPHMIATKKYVYNILSKSGSDYYDEQIDEFITRICSVITTEKDMQALGNLCVKLFESGYMEAINQYKEQLKANGLKLNIVPEKQHKENDTIFN